MTSLFHAWIIASDAESTLTLQKRHTRQLTSPDMVREEDREIDKLGDAMNSL